MMSDDYCYLNKWYNTYKATNANCTHSTLYTVLLYRTIFSVFAWHDGGWTWSCTLAWCWMKTWKIFVCEAINIIILRGGPVLPHQKIIWGSKTKHKAGTRITTQKAATMIYVRFKVTVCVYSVPPALRQICLQLWLSWSIETLYILHNCSCRPWDESFAPLTKNSTFVNKNIHKRLREYVQQDQPTDEMSSHNDTRV